MHQFRVLLITSGGLSALASDIEEWSTNVNIIEVTQQDKLDDALTDLTYDAVFLQNPLAWISHCEMSALLSMHRLTCPIISCSHTNIYRLLNLVDIIINKKLLFDISSNNPDIEVQWTV